MSKQELKSINAIQDSKSVLRCCCFMDSRSSCVTTAFNEWPTVKPRRESHKWWTPHTSTWKGAAPHHSQNEDRDAKNLSSHRCPYVPFPKTYICWFFQKATLNSAGQLHELTEVITGQKESEYNQARVCSTTHVKVVWNLQTCSCTFARLQRQGTLSTRMWAWFLSSLRAQKPSNWASCFSVRGSGTDPCPSGWSTSSCSKSTRSFCGTSACNDFLRITCIVLHWQHLLSQPTASIPLTPSYPLLIYAQILGVQHITPAHYALRPPKLSSN